MKPKTYNFKGKTVIAVKKTEDCIGCVFFKLNSYCDMSTYDGAYDNFANQKAAGMPNCFNKEIIFKLATDENQPG